MDAGLTFLSEPLYLFVCIRPLIYPTSLWKSLNHSISGVSGSGNGGYSTFIVYVSMKFEINFSYTTFWTRVAGFTNVLNNVLLSNSNQLNGKHSDIAHPLK